MVGRGADLDEELEVDIVGLGRCALGLLVAAAGDEIDTLRGQDGIVVTVSLGVLKRMSKRRGYHCCVTAARRRRRVFFFWF